MYAFKKVGKLFRFHITFDKDKFFIFSHERLFCHFITLMPNNFLKQIKEFISQNKLQEAIDLITSITPFEEEGLETSIVLLQRRLNQLNEKKRDGTLLPEKNSD